MPCHDPRDNIDRDEDHKGAAIACAIFSQAEEECYLSYIIDKLDYNKIGLNKAEVYKWWGYHKKRDNGKGEY